MRDEFEMKSNYNNVILVDTVRLKNDVRVSSVLVVYPGFPIFVQSTDNHKNFVSLMIDSCFSALITLCLSLNIAHV